MVMIVQTIKSICNILNDVLLLCRQMQKCNTFYIWLSLPLAGSTLLTQIIFPLLNPFMPRATPGCYLPLWYWIQSNDLELKYIFKIFEGEASHIFQKLWSEWYHKHCKAFLRWCRHEWEKGNFHSCSSQNKNKFFGTNMLNIMNTWLCLDSPISTPSSIFLS